MFFFEDFVKRYVCSTSGSASADLWFGHKKYFTSFHAVVFVDSGGHIAVKDAIVQMQ